jgi:Fe-S cluster assembly ATP-binding protein
MTEKKPSLLSVRNIEVYANDKHIVKGVDLTVNAGEVHAVMGPNGSGKSTFASALAGHPFLTLFGEVLLEGEEISTLTPDERALKGLFLGFQYPVAVPGVTVAGFIKAALEARENTPLSLIAFRKQLTSALERLDISTEFASRYINDGFSGGEKKRLEILQMLLLKPKVALLDEIDSGLDIDALKTVAGGINHAREAGAGIVLVTHYQRILDYVKPDAVHVFKGGRIVKSGGPEQALELEAKGYEWLDAPKSTAGGI